MCLLFDSGLLGSCQFLAHLPPEMIKKLDLLDILISCFLSLSCDVIQIFNVSALIFSNSLGSVMFKIVVVNHASTSYHITTSVPIGQVVLQPYMAATFRQLPRLSDTVRGTMTFEKTDLHLSCPAPSGSQSPRSLFGDLFPR